MAHTSRCSNAKTDSCRCSCGGRLHGVGTGLVRAAAAAPVVYRVSSPGLRPAGKQIRSRRSRAISRATSEVEGWLAAATASPSGSIQAVTGQTVGMVSDAVANAVVNALNSHGYHWTSTDHVVCAFLAAAAHAMQELEDQFERAVSQIVSAVLTAGRSEHRPVIPEALARVAAQAAVNALMRLAAIQHFDNLLRGTRILAILKCPDPQRHRAVVRYCLSPLEKDILSEATRKQLTNSLPKGWVTSRAAIS